MAGQYEEADQTANDSLRGDAYYYWWRIILNIE
jgi:hypothetical protein